MDKKMHNVTKKIRTAASDIKNGKEKAAERILKSAANSNEKLVKIDRNKRDPMINKFKKAKKDLC